VRTARVGYKPVILLKGRYVPQEIRLLMREAVNEAVAKFAALARQAIS
jgi:hypothetical protein